MTFGRLLLWRMPLRVIAVLLTTLSTSAAPASAVWDGTLDLGILGEARVSINLSTDTTSISSPDNHWSDVKANSSHTGQTITLSAPSIGVNFNGQVASDGATIVGTWIQSGRIRPVVFYRRVSAALPSWPELQASAAIMATPTDAEVDAILRKRVDDEHQSIGMVVGVIDKHGRRIRTYGRSDTSDPRPLNGNTVFEIGSISKVFTSLLLVIAVSDGHLKLDDPASKYAPPDLVIPHGDGREISLADLSTHTSGLPNDDDAFWGSDPDRPTAHYDVSRLFHFVSGASLSSTPGAAYAYSNVGGALLGQLLAIEGGKPYEELLKEKVTGPLGMPNTGVIPNRGAQVAVGHNAKLEPLPPFNAQAYNPAGGLRSTADDVLTFLGGELGYIKNPLSPSLRAQWDTVRRQAVNPRIKVALGWHVTLRPNGEIIWHNGGTNGVRSFAGFNPKTGVGVVVLSNTYGTKLGPDDIGLHVLDPAAPLDVLAPAANPG
jgi:CubicO group peptidase (beta-lactamase class C family)